MAIEGPDSIQAAPDTGMPEKAAHDAAAAFAEAVSIMARLRGPEGCPWDREQDFDSIRKHTLEEAYEVLDAIERRNWPDLKDELGDLLLQVLFYAQMASEPGHFTIAEVVSGLNRKLVRRHPHVFGDERSRAAGNAVAGALETRGIGSEQVLRNWDAIKTAERRAARGRDFQGLAAQVSNGTNGEVEAVGTVNPKPGEAGNRLASISRSMPALMEAAKLGSRAAKSGFDWPDVQGLFAKIDEEIAELREAMAAAPATGSATDAATTKGAATIESKSAVGEELGDLLFTVVNLARHLKVDPEIALREANAKFRGRFGTMETRSALPLEELSPEQLEELWATAKRYLAPEPHASHPATASEET